MLHERLKTNNMLVMVYEGREKSGHKWTIKSEQIDVMIIGVITIMMIIIIARASQHSRNTRRPFGFCSDVFFWAKRSL